MTQKTRAQLNAEYLASLPTNAAQVITAATVRTVFGDVSDSALLKSDDLATAGPSGVGLAGKAVGLDAAGKIPALDGSLLTNVAGVGATVIDTSAGAQAVTFDGVAGVIKRYKHIGANNLTINVGAGQTFEGGGAAVISSASGDSISLMLSGTTILIIGT